MRLLVRTTVLFVAAMSLAWHGVLLSTPHNHADNAVPQEELACSASHPTSQTYHLHVSGNSLTPHPCLACVFGSTVAEGPGITEISDSPAGTSFVTGVSTDLRARYQTQLPLLRGPPLTT
ncbi:MAG: hypothetical protein OQK55_03895 [Thermoanaerobaculales bacterium]|nr:hypothetical protein [Thermoanaerobaculales bacterium]